MGPFQLSCETSQDDLNYLEALGNQIYVPCTEERNVEKSDLSLEASTDLWAI